MVKSIHIGRGCALFIGEQVEVRFKISLLHLVPRMPSSLCLVRCYCHGVPGFHPKSRSELQKKPPKALWVDVWGYSDTHTISAHLSCSPTSQKAAIDCSQSSFALMHADFFKTMCRIFTTTENPNVLCIMPLCVRRCSAGTGLSLFQLDSCRCWCWCAVQPLLWGMIHYHSFWVQCLAPCRVEPLAHVTTYYCTFGPTRLNSFLQVNTS